MTTPDLIVGMVGDCDALALADRAGILLDSVDAVDNLLIDRMHQPMHLVFFGGDLAKSLADTYGADYLPS